jgi:DNA-binding Lrp family transcriptional regulator
MKLDRIDIKILSELQKNGRISNVELADVVHLSAGPCLMRVKKLQAEGFILGYSATIDVAKLGETLTVFTEITLKNHRQIDFSVSHNSREDRFRHRVPPGFGWLRLSGEFHHGWDQRVSDDHGASGRARYRNR